MGEIKIVKTLKLITSANNTCNKLSVGFCYVLPRHISKNQEYTPSPTDSLAYFN